MLPTVALIRLMQISSFRDPLPIQVGLFGVLPGIIGTYMANEVIKIITEAGEVLSGKILLINIFNNTFSTIKINNNPENHNITEINDVPARSIIIHYETTTYK